VQVNLDGASFNCILIRVERDDVDANLFDHAQKMIFRLMEVDSFPRFVALQGKTWVAELPPNFRAGVAGSGVADLR